MYEILIAREAEKYYRKQDRDSKRRLNKCLEILEKDPLSGPNVKRLHGKLEGKYRYALGALRVVYEVDTKSKVVKIMSIGGRGDVYK